MSIPKDYRRTHCADPWLECVKAKNRLFYGDENHVEGSGNAKTTIYRGVVVLGCVLRARDFTGESFAVAGGAYGYDPRNPEYLKVMAAQLRQTADDLERLAGS